MVGDFFDFVVRGLHDDGGVTGTQFLDGAKVDGAWELFRVDLASAFFLRSCTTVRMVIKQAWGLLQRLAAFLSSVRISRPCTTSQLCSAASPERGSRPRLHH